MSPGDDVASLARNEQRYRSLVQAFSEFVWVCDGEGRLINDMPWWRSITGQSAFSAGADGLTAARRLASA